jgi:cytochrome c-type biogenesis protein CcmH/NrfG
MTDAERLAAIEALITTIGQSNARIEAKLDRHMARLDGRVSALENFRWYATGLFTAVITAVVTYFKAHTFSK